MTFTTGDARARRHFWQSGNALGRWEQSSVHPPCVGPPVSEGAEPAAGPGCQGQKQQ